MDKYFQRNKTQQNRTENISLTGLPFASPMVYINTYVPNVHSRKSLSKGYSVLCEAHMHMHMHIRTITWNEHSVYLCTMLLMHRESKTTMKSQCTHMHEIACGRISSMSLVRYGNILCLNALQMASANAIIYS